VRISVSAIVTLDSQEPKTGTKKRLESVMDSTAVGEEEIDLAATHRAIVALEEKIQTATRKHNEYLKELGLSALPSTGSGSSQA
jgi:hypothetical protein